MEGFVALCAALGKLQKISLANCGLGAASASELAKAVSSADASLASLNLSSNSLTGASRNWSKFLSWENIDSNMAGFIALCAVLGKLNEVNFSHCHLGPASATELAKIFSVADATIEKVNVSSCNLTDEAATQLLTAANEASRARLRAHQVLAFSEAFHARLGSECFLQVVYDIDVLRRVAKNVRARHGHEVMCSRLAQAGQKWF
eukprot:COSAG05_NODE_9578_length_614_cov_1.885437_1_plen_204_part_11